jgi:hypothetical protein
MEATASSPLFEIELVFVRLDHVASRMPHYPDRGPLLRQHLLLRKHSLDAKVVLEK